MKKSGKDPKVGVELRLGEMSRKTTVRSKTPIIYPYFGLVGWFGSLLYLLVISCWFFHFWRCVIVQSHLNGMRRSASLFVIQDRKFLFLRWEVRHTAWQRVFLWINTSKLTWDIMNCLLLALSQLDPAYWLSDCPCQRVVSWTRPGLGSVVPFGWSLTWESNPLKNWTQGRMGWICFV